MKLTLPLPPKELSPNHTVGSRGMRMAKAAKIKQFRARVAEEAMVWCAVRDVVTKMNNHPFPWRSATIQLTFYHKDARRRDTDNLLASCKAAFDGLRDAGVLTDDDQITHLPVIRHKDKHNPRLEMEVMR